MKSVPLLYPCFVEEPKQLGNDDFRMRFVKWTTLEKSKDSTYFNRIEISWIFLLWIKMKT